VTQSAFGGGLRRVCVASRNAAETAGVLYRQWLIGGSRELRRKVEATPIRAGFPVFASNSGLGVAGLARRDFVR